MMRPSNTLLKQSSATLMIMYFSQTDPKPTSMLETILQHLKMQNIVSSNSFLLYRLNPTWGRGYQRKGTALYYMNKISEAIEAYKEGLTQDPENQQLKNDLKTAEDKEMQSQQGLLQAYLKLANNP